MGVAAIIGGIGVAVSAAGSLTGAEAAGTQSKNVRDQHYRRARETLNAAQRKSAEIRRQGKSAVGDSRAAMAAAGGVTDDAGAKEQLDNIEAVSNYNALAALYEGSAGAQQLRFAGDVARYSGKMRKKAGIAGAMGGAAQGGAQLYNSFKTPSKAAPAAAAT